MNKYMELAIKEAKKAYKKGEVPVGAIIVKDNKIISKAYNKKEKTKNSINHAEIIAIQKACKKLNSWRLENCEIYVTLEPCIMCSGAIIESRIKTVYYGLKNTNTSYLEENNKYNIKIVNMYYELIEKMLKTFFQEKRK